MKLTNERIDEMWRYSTEHGGDTTQQFVRHFARAIEAELEKHVPHRLNDPLLQELFSSAILGAMAFGAQGANKPPSGHWLTQFWEIGRNEEKHAQRWIDKDRAETELWLAIEAAGKIGNRTDDKLILEALRDKGLWLAEFGPPAAQGGEGGGV